MVWNLVPIFCCLSTFKSQRLPLVVQLLGMVWTQGCFRGPQNPSGWLNSNARPSEFLQCLVIQFLQHFPTQPSWRVKSKHSFVVLSCGPGVFSDQTVCGRRVRVPDPYLLLYWPCWWIIHQHHVAPWIQTTFHLRWLESAGNILDKVCNYGLWF